MAMNAGEIIAPMVAQYQREQREQFQREQREKEREKFNNLRQLKIGQEVKKYKTPAAKRAVSFLLESKNDWNDWNDCFDEFKSLVGDDGNLISLDENKDKVESFLRFFVKFSNMRTRKCKKELESYEIANR